MSTEFGADTTLDEVGWSERLAARAVEAWLPLADRVFSGQRLTFDAERLRLSLHGESEYPGDGFQRGQLVASFWLLNAVLAVLPIMLVTSIPLPEGSPLVWAFLPIVIASAAAGCVLVSGSVGLISETEFIDHTVEKQPEELDELQEQFVDGDLDRGELESEVERVIDR